MVAVAFQKTWFQSLPGTGVAGVIAARSSMPSLHWKAIEGTETEYVQFEPQGRGSDGIFCPMKVEYVSF